MLFAVEGIYRNGVAIPSELVEGHEGTKVIIIFMEEPVPQIEPTEKELDESWERLEQLRESLVFDSGVTELTEAEQDSDWERLQRLTDELTFDSGVTDLGFNHDHYLYGTPKRKRDEE